MKQTVRGPDGKEQVREVGHSKAWQTLVDEHKDKDRTCVKCHSIGFNEPGGYCKVSEVDFRKNVQCESCHGPGSLHVQGAGDVQALRVSEVNEAVCRRCHQVPHIESYESFRIRGKTQVHFGTPATVRQRFNALHDSVAGNQGAP